MSINLENIRDPTRRKNNSEIVVSNSQMHKQYPGVGGPIGSLSRPVGNLIGGNQSLLPSVAKRHKANKSVFY